MTDSQNNPRRTHNSGAGAGEQSAPRVLDAEALFAGSRVVKLTYQDEEYSLRITRNSKLILTK